MSNVVDKNNNNTPIFKRGSNVFQIQFGKQGHHGQRFVTVIMEAKIYLAIFSILVTFCSAKKCIPPQTSFYWKSPCDKQTYPNLLTVTDVQATQSGLPVDANGGFNMEIPIDIVTTGTNTYGRLTTPLMTIEVYKYGGMVDCSWEKQPTLDKLDNLDGCKIITSDCHMSDMTATEVKASIDMKALLGTMIEATVEGDYYALAVTTMDGTKPLQCVWSQDKVVKK